MAFKFMALLIHCRPVTQCPQQTGMTCWAMRNAATKLLLNWFAGMYSGPKKGIQPDAANRQSLNILQRKLFALWTKNEILFKADGRCFFYHKGSLRWSILLEYLLSSFHQ